MVQVSYPGVYVKEVPSGVHTITGVATSVAAFFGRTADGPINQAQRCLSYADFLRAFRGAHRSSDLAESVRQFFENGGTDCYVVRLAHNPVAAAVTLRNLDEADVLEVTARHPGVRGNGIRLEVDYATENPEAGFNLRVQAFDGDELTESEEFGNLNMDPDSPRFAPTFVTQESGLIRLALPAGLEPATATGADRGYSESRRAMDFDGWRNTLNQLLHGDPADRRNALELRVNDGPFEHVVLSRAEDAALPNSVAGLTSGLTNRINNELDNGVEVAVTLEDRAGVRVLRITSATEPFGQVEIRRPAERDAATPLMLGLDQGGVEVPRYSALRPAPTGTVFTGEDLELGGMAVEDFVTLTIGGHPVELVKGADHALATTEDAAALWREDAYATDVTDNLDGVREKLAILAGVINEEPDLEVRAEVWGYRLALIPTAGTSQAQVSVVAVGDEDLAGDFTENVRRYSLGTGGQGDYQNPGDAGRDDDGSPPDLADYRGNAADGTGFHALDTVDLFNLMVLPRDHDIAETDRLQLLGPASIYCEQNRAMLLIDAPRSWTRDGRPAADKSAVDGLRALVVKDHSAIFYPDLIYNDRGLKKTIGPTGAIAGLMARIDASRGVWKAPAGTEATLRGILGLEAELTDGQNGVLNPLAVNCLRVRPGGFVNWGARTFAGADGISTDWKYIPVRRLALFMAESLYRGTHWVVFEPNDEPLWAKIRLNLGSFMTGLFRQGAFQGSTPDQAFYVKCDGETTTQHDRNRGIVNIEVGFAPLKPAEFVVIRIQQMAGEL